jgi:hypothetical protein
MTITREISCNGSVIGDISINLYRNQCITVLITDLLDDDEYEYGPAAQADIMLYIPDQLSLPDACKIILNTLTEDLCSKYQDMSYHDYHTEYDILSKTSTSPVSLANDPNVWNALQIYRNDPIPTFVEHSTLNNAWFTATPHFQFVYTKPLRPWNAAAQR